MLPTHINGSPMLSHRYGSEAGMPWAKRTRYDTTQATSAAQMSTATIAATYWRSHNLPRSGSERCSSDSDLALNTSETVTRNPHPNGGARAAVDQPWGRPTAPHDPPRS